MRLIPCVVRACVLLTACAAQGSVVLPASYDATDRYAGEPPCAAFAVRQHASNASSDPFAVGSVFGARLCLNEGRGSGTNVLLSPRQLAGCAGSALDGARWYAGQPARGREEWCLPYLATAPATDCPLSRRFAAKDVREVRGAAAMQAELLRDGPFVASFRQHTNFSTYAGGVYVAPSAAWTRNHSAMLIGWGTDSGVAYWKLQNSWGEGWGERGTFRIRRGTDECGIESRAGVAFTPLRAAECPESPCANGSITLGDCSCQCVGPLLGGPLCDTVVNPCQNGGQPDPWRTSCLCPTGTSGPLCQHGFFVRLADTASCSQLSSKVALTFAFAAKPAAWSLLAAYTLAEIQPLSYSGTQPLGMCPTSTNCLQSGIAKVPLPPTPGRYRIILAQPVSGVHRVFTPATPIAAYHTVLPSANCTAALPAARAANSPGAPIAAAVADETARLIASKARLDAAAAPQAQLRALALKELQCAQQYQQCLAP